MGGLEIFAILHIYGVLFAQLSWFLLARSANYSGTRNGSKGRSGKRLDCAYDG